MPGREGKGQSRMPDGKRCVKCIYFLVVLGLSVLLYLLSFRDWRGAKAAEQPGLVIFGDSVLGEIRDETAVPAKLEEALGIRVYNGAMGGTCAARIEPSRRLDYTKDSLSLAGLLKSVEADDFGVQQSIIMRESNTEYFARVIDGLEEIDFSRVETVLIQQGVNDYHAGVPLDNPENPYDERSFLGALRTAVRSLRKVNPEVRILFVTPTYTWYPGTGLTCQEADYGGGTLEEYVRAELELAAELGVEALDMYHDLYPHEEFQDWQRYTRDGIHPNEEGRERLAGRLLEYFSEREAGR